MTNSLPPPAEQGRDLLLLPLPWLLRSVNRRYLAAIRARLAELDLGELPPRGYWALMALSLGGAGASGLVERMDISKQAVSKVVDLLVESDFVDRRTNDTDRRRTDLLLTAKGHQAVGAIEEVMRTTETAFVAELGSEGFADLVRLLARLAGSTG